MKKLLFLTTELPYPLDNGGKIRTYNMIKGLSSEYQIDVICFSEINNNENSINALKKICSDVYVFDKLYTNSKSKINLMKNIIFAMIKKSPFIINKFADNRYTNIVKKLLTENKYDLVIADHLQVAQFLSDEYLGKAVLSQHNCEYLILKRMAEESSNFIKKKYIEFEAKKLEKYEKMICSKFKKVILLSNEDKEKLVSKEYDGNNSFILPISVSTEFKKTNINKSKKNILFLGTMSWMPNEQGISWFLKNVWGSIKDEGYKLYIVGKNPSDRIKQFESDNVIITGYVDDINEYIDLCDISVVPLFIGGGMRVKILESMAKRIPIISTTIGAEGIEVEDGKDILIANTEEEFIEKINNINNEHLYNEIIKNADRLIGDKYSIEAINKKLINSLVDLK